MHKNRIYLTQNPAINMTVVGFGNAGSRIADIFASYRKQDNTPTYNCFAFNSNTGDLQALEVIPKQNQYSLELGGLGKNPTKATQILEENSEVNKKLKSFITETVKPNDDLILFLAGLGGGTGTSTIVKAITEFTNHHNLPIYQEELKKIVGTVGKEEYSSNIKKYKQQALKNAELRFKKIGIIVTLPRRSEGPDVLRQVNIFAQKLWQLAKNRAQGIAFITFADNQHLYDQFKETPANELDGFTNFRDYANYQIASIFHGLNVGPHNSKSTVQLDPQDFKRSIMENMGSLVVSKVDRPNSEIAGDGQLIEMIGEAFKTSNLHSPINITNDAGEIKRVTHKGLLAVIDKDVKHLAKGSFIDDATDLVDEIIPTQLDTTLFYGIVVEKNHFVSSMYAYYKIDGLPERLEKGLVEEYEEYDKKTKELKFAKSEIKSIEEEEDSDFDFDFFDSEDSKVSADDSNSPIEEDSKEDDFDIDFEIASAALDEDFK